MVGIVHVRAYSRTRDGHAEHVSAHTRANRHGYDTGPRPSAAPMGSAMVSVEESPGEGIQRRYTVRDEAGAVLGRCEAHLDGSQICTIILPDGEEFVQHLDATEHGQLIPVQAQALPWAARVVRPLALGLYSRLLEALRGGLLGEGSSGGTPFLLQYRGLEGDREVERAVVGVLPNDRVEEFCPRTAEFQDIVTNAANTVERGSMSPQEWGVRVHQEVERQLDRQGLNPDIRVFAEYPLLNAEEARRGAAGSSVLDILHHVPGTSQICVYDVKTGAAGLGAEQATRIFNEGMRFAREHSLPNPRVIAIELRP